jgi:hypothetical protein
MKQKLGISWQDKYGLGETKPSNYVYDKDGNVKMDTAGVPVKRINSYLTTDVKEFDYRNESEILEEPLI